MTKIIASPKAYLRAAARTFAANKKASVLVKQYAKMPDNAGLEIQMKALFRLLMNNPEFRKKYAVLMAESGEFKDVSKYRNSAGVLIGAIAGLGSSVADVFNTKNQTELEKAKAENNEVEMMMQQAMLADKKELQQEKTKTTIIVGVLAAVTIIGGLLIYSKNR